MSSAKITLIGLYSFLMRDNVDLFQELILPEGIDKDAVIANILQKGSEFEVMYPDTNYMIQSIKYWSTKWYWSFDKWVKLINTEYDPLYNYDRTETWTDDNTHEDEHTIDNTGSTSGSQSESMTSENAKSAFDSSTYQPNDKLTTSDGIMSSTSATSKETLQTDGTYKNTHNGRMYGNIGVMSSQDMFNQEVDVAYFNLYDRIADIFINEYCIPIYV